MFQYSYQRCVTLSHGGTSAFNMLSFILSQVALYDFSKSFMSLQEIQLLDGFFRKEIFIYLELECSSRENSRIPAQHLSALLCLYAPTSSVFLWDTLLFFFICKFGGIKNVMTHPESSLFSHGDRSCGTWVPLGGRSLQTQQRCSRGRRLPLNHLTSVADNITQTRDVSCHFPFP